VAAGGTCRIDSERAGPAGAAPTGVIGIKLKLPA
jgi:hypothetical protein